jgi:hypothetical protein
MPRTRLLLATSIALTVAGSCTFSHKEAVGGIGPGGTGSTGGNNDGSATGDRGNVLADTNPVNGDACPPTTFNANNLPPDLLIVLDRSGSMDEDSTGMSCNGGCGANSKWTLMTAAINQVVAQSETQVNWGLKFFGSGSGATCNVANGASVAPAPMTAAAIAAAIAAPANQPATRTPTRAAELSAGTYLASLTDTNPKYILLATDGLPNCPVMGNTANGDEMGAIAAVSTVAGMGFPTFVIGIAADALVGATATLNSMAVAGMKPRMGTPQYYSVTTTADLAAALMAIQGMAALPCQFQLGGVPTDPAQVSVSVGGQTVPNSTWMYGPGNRSVIFPDTGPTCMMLKSGAIRDIKINLPCGVTVIP